MARIISSILEELRPPCWPRAVPEAWLDGGVPLLKWNSCFSRVGTDFSLHHICTRAILWVETYDSQSHFDLIKAVESLELLFLSH